MFSIISIQSKKNFLYKEHALRACKLLKQLEIKACRKPLGVGAVND